MAHFSWQLMVPVSGEDQLAQLQKILLRSLSMEMSVRADDFKKPEHFREWMDARET